MTFDIVSGIVLTALALISILFLTLWSRSIIDRIHTHSPGSLREIQKDILNGNKS